MYLIYKVWTKYSGQPPYRKEASLYLPGKTLEELEQHEDWQRTLIHLQDRKKEVKRVEKWHLLIFVCKLLSCSENVTLFNVQAIQRWRASKHRAVQIKIESQNEAERKETEAKNQVLQHKWVCSWIKKHNLAVSLPFLFSICLCFKD